jgi:pimeloyl-ACP methyl ester carboxylesterase
VSELHVTTWGDGEPVLFVHGSFVRGGATWAEQRPLADRYRLLFVDRRGFGDSPPTGGEDFERDADDIAELLGDGAHLVGHSYGAVISLIAAGRRPRAVRSLAVIEPPAFHLASASAAAQAMAQRVAAVLARASDFTPEAFYPVFLHAMGYDLETLQLRAWSDLSVGLPPESIAAFRASMHQRLPWEARVPLELLAAATFPKLVISGGWDTASPATRATAGAALLAVCDALAERIGAERTVIPGAFHSPHRAQPALFNARLAEFLDATRGDRDREPSPERLG